MNLQLNVNSQDPENNEYIQIWQNIGQRPSKLTFYAGIDSEDFWKHLNIDPKTTTKFSEVFKRGDEYLINSRYLIELEEKSLYLSFVELGDDFPNINTLHFYYDSTKIEHDVLLERLAKEYSPLFRDFQEDVVASKDNFFIVNYEKESFETIPTPMIPVKMDTVINYNDLAEKENELLEILNSSETGIITFFGPRGCGKTFFLRKLIPLVKRNFFYFPTYLLDNTYIFNHFLNSVKKQPKSVLVLEDSENYFGQGSRSSRQHVEAILSSVESLAKSNDLQILLCLNVDSEDQIEDDIFNSNAHIFYHFFDKLQPVKANKLAKKLKNKSIFTEPVKLSTVYNTKKPTTEKRKPGYTS
jgi:hypothetical protein